MANNYELTNMVEKAMDRMLARRGRTTMSDNFTLPSYDRWKESGCDDGLGSLCEHHCHGCGTVLFNHKPNVACWVIQHSPLRAEPRSPRIMEVLCELCAGNVGSALGDHFAELAEIWTAYRDSVYERSGLTQCCDAPRMHTWERDGESNLGPDRCDACREFVDSCGRRCEP